MKSLMLASAMVALLPYSTEAKEHYVIKETAESH